MMHHLTAAFIRNPVAANLLMLLIIFLGLMSLWSIRIEGFPRLPAEYIDISTVYPDATAAQVDELVTQKIERALEGLDGVRSVNAQSENGISTVQVRRKGGQALSRLLDKVRLRIEAIDDFPHVVRRPVIETSDFDFPALYINLHGHTDPLTLQKLSEQLRESLLIQPELSRLKIWGLHEREMRIEIDPLVLRRLDLTVADVVDKVRDSSLDFQAGQLRTSGGYIYLRADSKAKYSTQFMQIPVLERTDGSIIRLGEIAKIRDDFAEGEYLFRFNGETTTGMEVLVGQKENLLHISEVVHQVVEKIEQQLPANISVTVWGDSSDYISARLQLLKNNGVQGLLLVILLLALFLNLRLAFWVAMGIPISILGAIAVAGSSWVDYSLNDVTTFGLIIVLGILVDDAVVVGESVFEQRSIVADPVMGTQQGVDKVSIATVFGVLTTIAAFFPLLLIDNPLGKVLAGFSAMVILALIFSLLESKFILPVHLAAIKATDLHSNRSSQYWILELWRKLQFVARGGLTKFRDYVYAPILMACLKHRYAVLTLFMAAGFLGIGLIGLGKIKTVFFPEVPGQIISINLEMDARAPFKLIRANMEKIQVIGERLNQELKNRYQLDKLPIRTQFVILSSAQSGQLYAELIPVAQRSQITITEIVNQWRQRTGVLEGAVELEFTGSEELAGGFQIKLLAKHPEVIRDAGKEIQAFINSIKGVSEVRDSIAGGQPEFEVRLKPEARHLGFTPQLLAMQIGYAYGGAEAQKIQRDSKEYRVLIRNQDVSRDSLHDLMQSQLRNREGEWIPFQNVAEIKGTYVTGQRNRENGMLVNTISAAIDRRLVAPEEVSQAVFASLVPILEKKYPTLHIKTAGELEEMVEIKGGMLKALWLAAVLIYILMAIPLRSYWQPLVILAIVPFGFIGAAIGHLIVGIPLSLLSFFGMLALTGVVINDSLVLITRYNQNCEEGKRLKESLQHAGIARFQAIFLTTATTVVGLLPLLLEKSEQAQYLIPAAVSLAFGELFSTLLMLILVPVLVAIGEDIKQLF